MTHTDPSLRQRRFVTSGWLTFGGVMLLTAGIVNVIDGLVALLRNSYYVVTAERILVLDFTTWGWLWLIVGGVQILVGVSVFSGQMWARVVGVVIAVLAAIGQLLFLAAYPLWSIVVIALCVLVIYALTVPPESAVDA